MKKTLMALVFAASLIVPGCSLIQQDQVQQVSSIIMNGPILINDIETVYDELAKLQKEKNIFSSEELEVFEYSMYVFDMVKTEYEVLTDLEMIPNTDDAKVMWREARAAYIDSMAIINSKRTEYGSKILINLDIMDAHAKLADDDISALFANPTVKNITDALQIIGGLAKIGAKITVLI